MGGLDLPQPNTLQNLGSPGSELGLTLEQGHGGLGGSIGSNSTNHDKRLGTLNSGLMNSMMNDSSNNRSDGVGNI